MKVIHVSGDHVLGLSDLLKFHDGIVAAVGGFKMKVLAAHRAGLITVILPRRIMPNLDELPEDVYNEMTFIPIERIDEAIKIALRAPKGVPSNDQDKAFKECNSNP